MKILLVNKYFFVKGGAENSFFQMASLLEKKGNTLIFFSMKHDRNISSVYSKYFISNVDYQSKRVKDKVSGGLKLLYSIESKKRIEELIRAEKPDIAHLNNIYHQISPSIIHVLKQYRIPIVMTLRDYKLVCPAYSLLRGGRICEDCEGQRFLNCFLNCCVKNSRMQSLLNTFEMYFHHRLLKIYNYVDVFISPSKFLKGKLIEMGFKGNIVHLSNFVNLEDFVPQFNWIEKYVIYFGRLSREKGLETLIEAIQGVSVKLKIVGEGPLRPSLESNVKERGITNVEFLGYKNGADLTTLIRNSMFVILPSEWYENNPRTIIEGFALGKPAIGARIGGIPELVKDYETGFTFSSGNCIELRSKIKLLLERPDLIVEMGRKARSFVEAELNAEKHYHSLLGIYQRLI